MILVINGVVGVDLDLVEVIEYAYIQQVRGNIVNETLECGWGISESKGHNTPFKGTVASMEGDFPLIIFLNLDKMVRMPEINFSEELSLVRTVKEIRDVVKQAMVCLRDFVEVPEIDAKSKETIFLLDKQDWSTTQRVCGMDEIISKMLVNELMECPEFVYVRIKSLEEN